MGVTTSVLLCPPLIPLNWDQALLWILYKNRVEGFFWWTTLSWFGQVWCRKANSIWLACSINLRLLGLSIYLHWKVLGASPSCRSITLGPNLDYLGGQIGGTTWYPHPKSWSIWGLKVVSSIPVLRKELPMDVVQSLPYLHHHESWRLLILESLWFCIVSLTQIGYIGIQGLCLYWL